MNKTDKVYKVEVTTPIQEFYLRVPKGVEVNEEILEKSWFTEPEVPNLPTNVSFSEVEKELWNDYHPSLYKDGDISFD